MKKSLFVHAREQSEKKAIQANIMRNTSVAYEEYLEKRIRVLEEKNKTLLSLGPINIKSIATEGFVDKIKDLFKKKEKNGKEHKEENKSTIELLKDYEDALSRLRSAGISNKDHVTFYSGPLAYRSNKVEIVEFLSHCEKILAFANTYYTTLVDVYGDMLKVSKDYAKDLDKDCFKLYDKYCLKMPSIKSLEKISFRPEAGQKHLGDESKDAAFRLSDKNNLLTLSYSQASKFGGHAMSFCDVNYIEYVSEKKLPDSNKVSSVSLSEADASEIIKKSIDLVNRAIEIHDSVGIHRLDELWDIAGDAEQVATEAEDKHGDEYEYDGTLGVAYNVHQGRHDEFYDSCMHLSISVLNSVIKALA